MSKRQQVSLSTKYEAILQVDRGTPRLEVAKQHGVSRTAVNAWLKDRQKIFDLVESGTFSSKAKRARRAEYPDVEEALVEWLTKARDQGWAISGPLLKEKAELIAKEKGHADFTCSEGWLTRFKNRHMISFRSIRGESRAAPDEAIDQWRSTVLPKILAEFAPEDIFNADETGLFFRLQPDKTMVLPGDDCKGGKLPKDRITVLPCANMTGTQKLSILIIGRSKQPRCFKKINTLPTQYQSNHRAWMTQEIFREWLAKLDRKMAMAGRRIALLLDNAPGHTKMPLLTAVKIFFFPPNSTSKLQPMDQGIIRSLKSHYRREFVRLGLIETMERKQAFNWTILDAMYAVRRAWDAVTPSTISNCFCKAGVSPEASITLDEEDPDDDVPLSQLFRRYKAQGAEVDEEAFKSFINADEQVATTASEEATPEDQESQAEAAETEEEEDADDDDVEPTLTNADFLTHLHGMRTAAMIMGDHTLLAQLERSAAAWEAQRQKVQKKIPEMFKVPRTSSSLRLPSPSASTPCTPTQ